MVESLVTEKDVWDALQNVMDPEIPKLSLVDMGIITSVTVDENAVARITMTPTFAGCPAIRMMTDDIKEKISMLNVKDVQVEVNFDVQWSTDMLTEKGRQMLKESHFALPPKVNGFVSVDALLKVECPFCGSRNTRLQSPFGPTQCRAIHYCDNCRQAFEQFKPV